MANSMTGFGRWEELSERRKVTVEIKSVNHRYFDCNIKLPRKLNAVEGQIRNRLKASIARGKVDVYVSLEESAEGNYELVYHPEIARMYLQNLSAMAEEFGLANDVSAAALSRYPDVLEMRETEEDDEKLWADVSRALEGALSEFLENRSREGKRLTEDLLEKLQQMCSYVDVLEARSPQIVEEYRSRLMQRISEMLEDGKVDESRIATEVTIFADKVCIDEEIVRLKSHVKETIEALSTDGEIGRRLDFIAQEMNREANTVLSKSTDVEIANMGIELKTLIEKIREQIQNIE